MKDPGMPLAPTPTPAAPRRMKIALVASLALNLLFLGAIGGAMLNGGPDRRGGGPRELGFGPFTEALPPADRAALAQAFFRESGGPREMRREMRERLEQMVLALRTEPLDTAALQSAFDAMRERTGRQLDAGQRLLIERLEAMTPEERARFADRLAELAERGPMRDRRPPRTTRGAEAQLRALPRAVRAQSGRASRPAAGPPGGDAR